MEERGRAWRRWQYERRRDWWLRVINQERREWEQEVFVRGDTPLRDYPWGRQNNPERTAGWRANTAAWCSCYCCGNPRRHPGSRKERLSEESFKQQLEEIGEDA